MEGRLGLTYRRLNYPPTGTHPSPRSASVWRSTTRSTLLSSKWLPVPCTLWSLMANTARPHWVVSRGSRWLVPEPHCTRIAKKKGSTQSVTRGPEQKSVYLETMTRIAKTVTPYLGLGLEGTTMITTHVEIWIMTTEKDWASRQWGISWCSENKATAKQDVLWMEIYEMTHILNYG